MGGTDEGRRYAVPFRVIPEAGQVSENVSHSPDKETRDVLHEHEPGSQVANDLRERWPEPPAIRLREPLAGAADGLAGESSGHKVRGCSVSPPVGSGSHVVMPGHLRPVPREDAPAPRVDLHLPGDRHPGALEAEVEASETPNT